MTLFPSRSNPAALRDLVPGLAALAIDAPLGLWLLDHSAPFDWELTSWLSQEEWNRSRRFHFAWHSRRYLAAHAVLRGLIADQTGIAPSALSFERNADGKPALRGDHALPFSLSYSRGFSLIGIGAGPAVGVDIEQERIIHDAADLAELYFSPAERRVLNRIRDAKEKGLTFLHGWTRKEACLKAVGTGLLYPASLVETGLSDRRTTMRLSSATYAETASFVVAHHVVSWARILPRPEPVIAERASRIG